jgi:mono/diheme cytochrome c family protein
MKSGRVIVLVVVAAVGLLAGLATSVLHDGLSARATPTRFEAMLARNMRWLALPSGARTTPNPVRVSPENLRDARLHFADHCAICHANDGSGDTPIGRGLYPKPPDLRQDDTQKLADGELFFVIENGIRFTGMPALGGGHSNEDSWKLVHFIRHLSQLTAEERMEMERYNPKGPEDRSEEQQENEFLEGAPAPQVLKHPIVTDAIV